MGQGDTVKAFAGRGFGSGSVRYCSMFVIIYVHSYIYACPGVPTTRYTYSIHGWSRRPPGPPRPAPPAPQAIGPHAARARLLFLNSHRADTNPLHKNARSRLLRETGTIRHRILVRRRRMPSRKSRRGNRRSLPPRRTCCFPRAVSSCRFPHAVLYAFAVERPTYSSQRPTKKSAVGHRMRSPSSPARWTRRR